MKAPTAIFLVVVASVLCLAALSVPCNEKIIRAVSSPMGTECLTSVGGSTPVAGTRIAFAACQGGPLNSWTLNETTHQLRLVGAPSLCLQGGTPNGGLITFEPCAAGGGNAMQEWEFAASNPAVNALFQRGTLQTVHTWAKSFVDIRMYEYNNGLYTNDNFAFEVSPTADDLCFPPTDGPSSDQLAPYSFIQSVLYEAFSSVPNTCDETCPRPTTSCLTVDGVLQAGARAKYATPCPLDDLNFHWMRDPLTRQVRLRFDTSLCLTSENDQNYALITFEACNASDALQKWSVRDFNPSVRSIFLEDTTRVVQQWSGSASDVRLNDYNYGNNPSWKAVQWITPSLASAFDESASCAETGEVRRFPQWYPDSCLTTLGAVQPAVGVRVAFQTCSQNSADLLEWRHTDDLRLALASEPLLCVTAAGALSGHSITLEPCQAVDDTGVPLPMQQWEIRDPVDNKPSWFLAGTLQTLHTWDRSPIDIRVFDYMSGLYPADRVTFNSSETCTQPMAHWVEFASRAGLRTACQPANAGHHTEWCQYRA